MLDLQQEVVILGGGIAGLWLLAELCQAGYTALLLEMSALGQGQSIAAQGILHSGIKYSLGGSFHSMASAAGEALLDWERALAGQGCPDLSQVCVLSRRMYLWSTESLLSKLGLAGARWLLRVEPRPVTEEERPELLRGQAGSVLEVAEPVLSMPSLLEKMAAPLGERILQIPQEGTLSFERSSEGKTSSITWKTVTDSATLRIQADAVILAAGAGNAHLRESWGLPAGAMQLRPLQMVLLRGGLPSFFGHCVAGTQPRCTITSARDAAGRMVWYLGGQVAEAGAALSPGELIHQAAREIKQILPRLDLRGTEWSTERISRAEQAQPRQVRPPHCSLIQEGNILTVWPTKLVLAPQLARMVRKILPAPRNLRFDLPDELRVWKRPAVARQPWEQPRSWQAYSQESFGEVSSR